VVVPKARGGESGASWDDLDHHREGDAACRVGDRRDSTSLSDDAEPDVRRTRLPSHVFQSIDVAVPHIELRVRTVEVREHIGGEVHVAENVAITTGDVASSGVPANSWVNGSGLSRSGFWSIMNGEASPSLRTLEAIAELLGVSVADLVAEAEADGGAEPKST